MVEQTDFQHDQFCEHQANVCMDAITKRPRTPNDLYSEITKEQLSNMKKSAEPFYMKSREITDDKFTPRRFHVNRFTTCVRASTLRGGTTNGCYCFLGEKVEPQVVPDDYNSSMFGSSKKWGPNKAGLNTCNHNAGEVRDHFTAIDMYRRNPTNTRGDTIMRYGRPHEGYYTQKFPVTQTWFNSSNKLNQTSVLEDIRSKTKREYRAIEKQRRDDTKKEADCWPGISESKDRYTGKTRVQPLHRETKHGNSYYEPIMQQYDTNLNAGPEQE